MAMPPARHSGPRLEQAAGTAALGEGAQRAGAEVNAAPEAGGGGGRAGGSSRGPGARSPHGAPPAAPSPSAWREGAAPPARCPATRPLCPRGEVLVMGNGGRRAAIGVAAVTCSGGVWRGERCARGADRRPPVVRWRPGRRGTPHCRGEEE